MPQIDQLNATLASQVFWALIFFGFVYFVIGRTMVPRVIATVEAREKQIAADLSAAEAARHAASVEEANWNAKAAAQRAEAHALLAKAKHDAAVENEARLAAAAKLVDARLEEADGRLAAARASALAEIETIAAEATDAITQRLTGISFDAQIARGAVQEVLHG
jgi:F-type H+-transporting ATPase subunit b